MCWNLLQAGEIYILLTLFNFFLPCNIIEIDLLCLSLKLVGIHIAKILIVQWL